VAVQAGHICADRDEEVPDRVRAQLAVQQLPFSQTLGEVLPDPIGHEGVLVGVVRIEGCPVDARAVRDVLDRQILKAHLGEDGRKASSISLRVRRTRGSVFSHSRSGINAGLQRVKTTVVV
jgi:hypothetical protein